MAKAEKSSPLSGTSNQLPLECHRAELQGGKTEWTEPHLTEASPLKSISEECLYPVSSTCCPGSLGGRLRTSGVWVLGPRPMFPHLSISRNKPHSTPLPPNLGANTKLIISSSKKFNGGGGGRTQNDHHFIKEEPFF